MSKLPCWCRKPIRTCETWSEAIQFRIAVMVIGKCRKFLDLLQDPERDLWLMQLVYTSLLTLYLVL